MDALIFDFDGVVVDSEPLHLEGFQRVLGSAGLTLSKDEYYTRYLGCDDHDCIEAVARDKHRPLPERQIADLIAAKTAFVKKALADSIDPLPGVVELIGSASRAGVPVAICSGALRDEIELAGRAVGVWDHVAVVVAAEDVQRGKPDPEGYSLTAGRLAEALGRAIAPARCVVVEDSPAGVASARSAGMKVLAVTNSYEARMLGEASRIVVSLADVSVASLEELL